jgi:hypothetical protein
MKTICALSIYLKTLTESQKLPFIDKLQELLSIEYDWERVPSLQLPLSWEEIREMNESDVISIGSHTVTHPILSKCTPEQQRNELMFSRQRISEELGKYCTLFAYPNGGITDYNYETIRLLKELGYKSAVTTILGYNDGNNQNNYQLNRFGRGMSVEELGAVITGLSRIVGTI